VGCRPLLDQVRALLDAARLFHAGVQRERRWGIASWAGNGAPPRRVEVFEGRLDQPSAL